MKELATSFTAALRASGLSISPAETLDACRLIDCLGYAQRDTLREGLAITLAKSNEEKLRLYDCFDKFFTAHIDAKRSNRSNEEQRAAEDQATTPSGLSSLAQNGTMPANQGRALAARELSQIAAAARRVGLDQMRYFTQRGIYTERIMRALGESGDSAPLTATSEQLRKRVGRYVQNEFALLGSHHEQKIRERLIRRARLDELDRRQLKALHLLTQEISQKMAQRLAQRRRQAKKGRLDLRRITRYNAGLDSAPFLLHWKQRRPSRPQLVVICDVSGSMRNYSRLLLLFLFSLNKQLPKTRAFAFSSHLGEISKLFSEHPPEQAAELALFEHGDGGTDYAEAFETLNERYRDAFNRRTVALFLGDSRNNYGDARADELKLLAQRCHQIFWLNPEPRHMWATGDAEMRHYMTHCQRVETCGSLGELERGIERILRCVQTLS